MIQSVQRAAQILAVLGSGTPRLGVTEIADRVGLAKPTVHGLLRTLEAHELVAQDPDTGKYSLGPGVLQLGNAYLDGSDLRVRSLARPFSACMDTVAAAPAEAASASTDRASSGAAPSVIALLNALVAGASASTMVLSPSRAAPSCWTPARAASSAAARAGESTSAAPPSALPARRKAMPYSGPEAPPTLEIRVLPVTVKIAPGVAVFAPGASRATSTAVKPRARLMP